MSGLKILLIAPWGFPPQWKKSRYCVRDVVIAGKKIDGCCESCCSSFSLYMLLRSQKDIGDVRLVGIGPDTVIPPRKDSSLRENVVKWFNNVKKKLFETTSCEKIDIDNIWIKNIFVEVVPGIGFYYGYYFRCDIVKVFIEVYRVISRHLKEFSPSVIVLDTTHGLNILTIATLYASVAVSIIHDKNLYIFNSEPYPPGAESERCISGFVSHNFVSHKALTFPLLLRLLFHKLIGFVSHKALTTNPSLSIPLLNIHDISRLQQIIEFLRVISFLRYLNEKPLIRFINRIERDSHRTVSEKITRIARNVARMIESLRIGLLGLIYNNSKLMDPVNESIEDISFNIRSVVDQIRNIPSIDYDKAWIKPVIRNENMGKYVDYEVIVKDIPVEYLPVIDALKIFISEFTEVSEIDSFRDFTEKIASILNRKGYWEIKQIIINEKNNLLELAEKICRDEKIDEKTIEITGEKLIKYWKEIKDVEIDFSKRIVSPRNFVAHAALNYNIIEKIKIIKKEGKIDVVEIIYDRGKLLKTIEQIGDRTSLRGFIV